MSYRRNIQSLQRRYAVLKARGARLGVGFSVPKTELIHERTNRDRGPVSRSPIHLDGSIFPPKADVRSLGYCFTPSISTTTHFTKRLAQAPAAFGALKRLSPPGWAYPLSYAIGWRLSSYSRSSAMARTCSNPLFT